MKGEIPIGLNPEQKPKQIRRVNRLLLPALRLVSNAERLGIIEALATRDTFMRPADIQMATRVPTSSFFKFAGELGAVGLLTSSQLQEDAFDPRSGITMDREVSGAYAITPAGRDIINAFSDFSGKFNPLMADLITPKLIELGFRGKKLEEARTIFLASGGADLEESSEAILRVNRLLLPRLRLLSDNERLSIVEVLADQPSPIQTKELQDAAQVPHASFFKFADELVRQGLLMRVPRSRRYQLTQIGQEMLVLLFDIGDRVAPLIADTIATNIIKDLERRGISSDKLEDIKGILLRTNSDQPREGQDVLSDEALEQADIGILHERFTAALQEGIL